MGLITLEELKCSDLKGQLLLRGLSTIGKKNELKERLQQSLEGEGKDPDTFEFEIKSPIELAQEEKEAAQKGNKAAKKHDERREQSSTTNNRRINS